MDPTKWLKYAGCPLAGPRISPAERNPPAATQSSLNPTASAATTSAAATAAAVRVPVPVASRSTGSSARAPPPVVAPPSRDSGPRTAVQAVAGVRPLPVEKVLSKFGDYESESESDSSSGGEEGGYASRLAGSSFQLGGTPASNVGSLAYVNPKLCADAPAVNSSQGVSGEDRTLNTGLCLA